MILLHMACRVTHVTNIHHYGTSKRHFTSEKVSQPLLKLDRMLEVANDKVYYINQK